MVSDTAFVLCTIAMTGNTSVHHPSLHPDGESKLGVFRLIKRVLKTNPHQRKSNLQVVSKLRLSDAAAMHN